MSRKISTSALAKKHGLSAKQMFQRFESASFIQRIDEHWQLTNAGIIAGGEMKNHSKYGEYVAWPEALSLEQINAVSSERAKSLSATAIGKHFVISPIKVNHLLAELGWLEKSIKGWKVSAQGLRVGGIQNEDEHSGIPFVTWPGRILDNISLTSLIENVLETNDNAVYPPQGKYRAIDGHFLASQAELSIDNWLYLALIRHATQRRLPIDETLYAGFYLPDAKLYIEYWDSTQTSDDDTLKKEAYYKHGFNLIELSADDIQNLDEVLPRQLLKYGIQAY
ncbi:glycerol kinase [Alginatibacterium sediminis]|uniref:Glycerol kinase n=1 Tax=Alginatibacterium sediminis TaxID=2164068 RepID=A0A420ECM8_9ALTE|nr:glycerol kinase [Alginatibacterium sediminis]RKF18428.1 glycerol kinase [Alginatibacterium sediminis]